MSLKTLLTDVDTSISYKFTADTVARDDCSFTSNVSSNITAGEILGVDKTSGGWYHTAKGWIYIWKENNGMSPTSIVVKVTTNDTLIDKGRSVTLSESDRAVYDIYGKHMIPGMQYSIVDFDSTTGIVRLRGANGVLYHVRKELIGKTTVNDVIVLPGDIITASNKPDARSVAYQDTSRTGNENNGDTSGSSGLLKSIRDFLGANDNSGEEFVLRVSTARIFGMPYQWMDIADPHIKLTDGDTKARPVDFGSTYMDKIVARIPLFIMVPGIPEFADGYSEDEKQGFIASLTGAFGRNNELGDLGVRPNKYFVLKQSPKDYFRYVNQMCNLAAITLDIGDRTLDGIPLKRYDWENYKDKTVSDQLLYSQGVAFYINSETTYSESFGNATTQSALASKINGMSDIGREINFITGSKSTVAGETWDKIAGDNSMSNNMTLNHEYIEGIANSQSAMGNFIGAIGSGAFTVVSGGKLMFPEIWADSQFSRDYNITLKLTSPDNDNESLYHNIIVPLLHLIGFAAPHNVNTHGYISPFLVRCYYKGLFNCDMGMISSMSITRGGEGNWNASGIPTVVDVSINIKELYGQMSINDESSASRSSMLQNVTLMDYIGNLCGVNIQESDFGRISQYVAAVKSNTIRGAFRAVGDYLSDGWAAYAANRMWRN